MQLEERETLYHVDDFDGIVRIASWKKGVWAKCERIGMACTIRERDYREYTGKASDVGIGFRLRKRRGSRPKKAPLGPETSPST